MKAFTDFIPILLFFIAYIFYTDIPINYVNEINEIFDVELDQKKSSAIYFSTLVLMISCFIQVVTLLVIDKIQKIHYITFIIVLIAGFSTLYFKNPFFIKIKPSIVYWGFAIFFILNHFLKKDYIIKKLLKEQIFLENKKWQILENSWIIFFILCGLSNLYVANYFSEEAWVIFKFYILGIFLPILFIILNGVFIGFNAKK